MPTPTPTAQTTTLYLPLATGLEAVITLSIDGEGCGFCDPGTRREPTIKELDLIGQMLRDVRYKFYSTLL